MYGFVNSALEKLIKRRFGVEKWEEIRTHAKLFLGDQDSFHVNHIYNDADTYSMVTAAAEVLGLDAATILEMFGEQFLISCQESGYAKTLQLLGRSLQDFLTNLDALHDHLSIIYPQMDAPSFRCTAGVKKSEFLLHYYSDRSSLEHIVMGIVKSVAREYYHVELEMKVMVKKGENSDHTIFSIREMAYHRASVVDKEEEDQDVSSFSDRNLISSETFCKAFPFHIVFDSHMTILQVGLSLSWVMPNLQLNKDNLATYFVLERPRMKLSFENIMSHINTIFILRMIPMTASSGKHNSDRMSISLASGSDPMRLRGQMVYAPESEAMLFICSPRVKRLQDLQQRGLYLSDIPIHDATRGMLMMGQAAAAEFSKSVRLEELIIDLHHTQQSLEEEKKRMSDLLHQMLPISVADSLMAGQMVEAERFESVTILFSDIVGFTSICSQSEPMEVVNMLNRLYSMFDQVVGQNQVYKVETIGDAYMVVGGLPERNNIHAECVANQALDMMHYCRMVDRPDEGDTITMRIGIHSGAVVAGVVGRRMPRYCLFGNTVNVASRTESNGTPGKIQVTDYTHDLLADKPNFKFEYRDSLQFKNVPAPIKCYYLLENTDRPEHTAIVVSDEPEQVTFQLFSRTTDTPPATPMISQPRGGQGAMPQHIPTVTTEDDDDMPMFGSVPDLNVIKPTPTSTPLPTPPSSRTNSDTDETPLGTSTPPFGGDLSRPDSEATDSTQLPAHCPFFGTSPHPSSPEELEQYLFQQGTGSPPEQYQVPPYISVMRTSSASLRTSSMSPLKEDINEEENGFSMAINADEGIVMRKISDVSNISVGSNNGAEASVAEASSSVTKVPSRKISDVSDHSGESGIESTTSKVSDASKEGLPSDREAFKEPDREAFKQSSVERRLSDSSNDDELAHIRATRAGSVSRTVEKYDSLHRCRKSGVSTVMHSKSSSKEGVVGETSFSTTISTISLPDSTPQPGEPLPQWHLKTKMETENLPNSDQPEGESSTWHTIQQNYSSSSSSSM